MRRCSCVLGSALGVLLSVVAFCSPVRADMLGTLGKAVERAVERRVGMGDNKFGAVELDLRAEVVGNLEAKNGSQINVSQLLAGNSSVPSLKFKAESFVKNITATNGSTVDVATLALFGSNFSGFIDIDTRVEVNGDITADNLSVIQLGTFDFVETNAASLKAVSRVRIDGDVNASNASSVRVGGAAS
jgi:hypothetical protein